jgi:hypothetical protein
MLGIALNTTTAGNQALDVLIHGFVGINSNIINDTAATVGIPIYIREGGTGGDMSTNIPTTGIVRIVGYAYKSTTASDIFILRFTPDPTWVEI